MVYQLVFKTICYWDYGLGDRNFHRCKYINLAKYIEFIA